MPEPYPTPSAVPPPPRPPASTRGQRFLAGRYWLILKNVLGWTLILLSFVAGPLVPGPGGIPLFLIGFALISFPGKRRLTARVLRGRPVRFATRPFVLISLGAALVLGAVALPLVQSRSRWVAERYANGPFTAVALYRIAVALAWLVARSTPHVLNLLLRLVAAARHKFRPWLRRHRIRLLPPRRRARRPYEPGTGPFRLKDEILRFSRKRRPSDSGLTHPPPDSGR
jgi:hypothetical protein